MRLRVLLVGFVLFCIVSEVSAFNVTVNENGPISKILYNMELEFPDVSFRYLGLPVNIYNLTCYHFTAERLEGRLVGVSEILNPNTSDILFLNLTAFDMTLNCTANWTFSGDSGDMIMTLGSGTELGLRVSVSENMTDDATTIPPTATPSVSPSASNSSTPNISVSPSSNSSVSASPNATSATPMISPSANATISPTNSSVTPTISPGTNTTGNNSSLANAFMKHSSHMKDTYIPVPAHKQMKMIQEESTSEFDPPVFIFTAVNCSFFGNITYLHTSSVLMNQFSDEIIKEIDELMPEIVCDKMSEVVNTTIAGIANTIAFDVYNASYSLNGEPQEIFNDEGFAYAFLGATILFLIMIFVLLIIPTAIRLYQEHKRAEYGEIQPLVDDFASQVSVVLPKPSDSAMIMDRRLAWYWRYAILLTILYNVALFASATVSVASSVYIYLSAGTNVYRLPSIYSFMIVSSVIEMWEAGVYPLSLLIGITSGIWPYVKLIIMFFCLITPPKFLSKKWRKRILRVLDALGKWSLIDVYVLVLFIEAFRVHIPLGDQVAFDMAVQAQYAFFSYVLATAISLALTHVMLFVHDELEEPQVPENGKMEFLLNHKFHFGSQAFVATIVGKILVPVLILIAFAGVLAGSFVYAFELDWRGSLLGELLTLTGQENVKEFSVISLLKDIPNTSYNAPSGAGVRTIQVSYAMFVLVFPLLHLTSLLVVWIAPLTMQMQRGAYILIEIFSAWAAMDVFIVALIVALLELEQFAKFIISDKCNAIDQLLSKIAADGSGTCFTVKATLKDGSWILVGAVVVLLLVGYSVMYICNKAIHERKDKEIKHLQKTGSMSDFYEPDQSVSMLTRAIVTTFKTLFLVRFV